MFKINSFSKAALSTKPPLSPSQPTYVVVVEGLASSPKRKIFKTAIKKTCQGKEEELSIVQFGVCYY